MDENVKAEFKAKIVPVHPEYTGTYGKDRGLKEDVQKFAESIKRLQKMGPTKHDSDKVRTDLLPPAVLLEVAEVMTFGAKKYDDYNYLGLQRSRLYGAALRHLWAWYLGEEEDAETGVSHLAHAMCCVVMLRHCELEDSGEDDRK